MHVADPATEPAIIFTRTKRQAMEWSLVLASQEIPTTITQADDGRWALLVETQEVHRALESIRLYRQENRRSRWRQELPWAHAGFHWGAVFVCVLLAIVHQVDAHSARLHEAWLLKPAEAADGQWWRIFTAVLLHADLAHLLANVTTGVLLFGLAMARFGAGSALLVGFLCGAFGNLAGLVLHSWPYTGLGASGAVMGALGLLSFHNASLWRANPAAAKSLLRGSLAGVFLFLIFGVNPKSDVVAHVGGFVAGAAFGTLLSFAPKRFLEHPWFEAACWIVLMSLLGAAGLVGLMHG